MKEKQSKKKLWLAASVAGLVAMAGSIAIPSNGYAADVKCSGVNACKGNADCGGVGHGCAGKNDCKGQGWLNFPSEELCMKVGGTIVPQ